MGRGQTHKTQILDLYLSGYQFTEIERRIKHSETAIQRYIQDFGRVVLLHVKGFSHDQIRISTNFSIRLIGEYLKLYARHTKSPQLKRILQTSKKRGA
ncbi:MAG: DUF1670 domain-containing protein [Acidobacteriota bacterium]